MKTTASVLGLCLVSQLSTIAAGELPAATAAVAPAAAAMAHGAPAAAASANGAPAAVASGMPATPPAPVDVADAARPPMRLRDTLRHWFSGGDTQQEPFRLSSEERRRLREQLRTPAGPQAPAR